MPVAKKRISNCFAAFFTADTEKLLCIVHIVHRFT